MPRWAVFALVAVLAFVSGCGQLARLHPVKAVILAPAPVGDTCLVGRWTLQASTSSSGYSFNNQTVSVTGLRGSTDTFWLDGTEKRVFDGSEPLVGNLDGKQLSIKVSGSVEFTIHADNAEYVETGTKTQLPTKATYGGQPVDYQSWYQPTGGTYRCSSSTLTFVSSGGGQIDTWSRG